MDPEDPEDAGVDDEAGTRALLSSFSEGYTRYVRAGQTVGPVTAPVDTMQRLLVHALATAAGAGRGSVALRYKPLLWDTGTDQLLLHLAKATMTTGSGFVDLRLPVQCDETGPADVVMTYLTASPERPHGFVVATEDRPRGPALVVQVWGEALVALGWRALVELARRVAAARGTGTSGLPLVASTVVATPEGLTVTAMGPHRYGTGLGGSTR